VGVVHLGRSACHAISGQGDWASAVLSGRIKLAVPEAHRNDGSGGGLRGWVMWSMCAACFCPCFPLSRATPLGWSRYQTSEFPSTSEFLTELPTNMVQIRQLSARDRFRARREHLSEEGTTYREGNNLARNEQLKKFKGLLLDSQGQDLSLTVLYVPYSLDSG